MGEMSTPGTCGSGRRAIWPILVLGGCSLAWAYVLLFGGKPWELGIDARVNAGEIVPVDDFLKEGFWIAAAFNLLCALGLILTARWWSAAKPGTGPASRSARFPLPRWFLPAILGIVAVSAWLRLPALHHSLWNDEEYTLRRYVWGAWKVEKDESVSFRPADWKTTFWFDRGANNHIGFSVPAKISLGVWSWIAGARPGEFSEAALRLPALLLGIGSIALLAWVLAARGHPLVGLLAAAALAVHPWHMRYSTEARGYASLLFFSILAVHLLDRAMRSGQWRHWLAYAAAQFAYLYSFPGAVYLAVALNGWAVCALLARHRALAGPVARCLAANVVSAMAFVQLMGPCIHQIRLYLARDIARGTMGADWFLDVWCHFAAGVRWPADPGGQPLWATGSSLLRDSPLFAGVVFGLVPVLAVAGAIMAVRRGIGLFVLPAFVAAGLAYAHTALTGNFLFSWYLVFAVPALAVATMAPFGCTSLRSLGMGGVCLAVWYAGTAVPRRLIRDHDRQPLREAAVRLRGAVYPGDQDPRPLTVTVGTSAGQFRGYDPRVRFFDRDNHPPDLEAFEAIVARARQERRPLKVLLAGRSKEERVNARMVAAATDPARFRLADRLYGVEELFSFEIYELKENLEP
jgi:hypothetical protein